MIKAMNLLAEDRKVIFIGQSTLHPDVTQIYETLLEISQTQRIELPVIEDTQLGMSIGLALAGYLPVSIYPRMDFLVLAMNQLVNHLDKIEEMSAGHFKPKVIVRTAIGARKPLDPGPQHCQDHTQALKLLLVNTDVVRLEKAEEIIPAYQRAYYSEHSTILIELSELYYA